MAIGLARMFNVRFPLNFNSPYKAQSVIDYWQRWHMTLTRYLKLYLYNPIALAVTRRRQARGLPVNRAAHATPLGLRRDGAVADVRDHDPRRHVARQRPDLPGVRAAARALPIGQSCLAHPAAARDDSRSAGVGSLALTYLCVLLGAIVFRAPSLTAAVNWWPA